MFVFSLKKKKLPLRQRWTLLKIDLLPPSPCTLKWHLLPIILSNFNSSRQTWQSVLKNAILHDRDGHRTCTVMFIQQCESLQRNRCHCFLILQNKWYQLVPPKTNKCARLTNTLRGWATKDPICFDESTSFSTNFQWRVSVFAYLLFSSTM